MMEEDRQAEPEIFKASVSKVKTFDSCKKKYEFNYIIKAPRKQWKHFDFGHLLHQTLEEFHQVYIEGSTEPHSVVMGRAFKAAMKKYALKLSKEDRQEAYTIIDEYLKMIANNPKSVSSVLSVEKRFSIQLNDRLLLNGAIDRIEVGADGVLTVGDYKTTKQEKYLADDYFQLLTYAYVLLQEDPTIKHIRGAYIMLRHNFKRLETDFYYDDIVKVKELYEDYLEKIENENSWTENPSWLCNYCDYLNFCQGGQKFLHKDNGVIKHGKIGW